MSSNTYKTTSGIGGLFNNFTIVKMKGPNKYIIKPLKKMCPSKITITLQNSNSTVQILQL